MKFARHLEAQIPEWKNAYIDYHGLKKRITAIKKAQQASHIRENPSDSLIPLQLLDQNDFRMDVIVVEGPRDQLPLRVSRLNASSGRQSQTTLIQHSSELGQNNVNPASRIPEPILHRSRRRSSTLISKVLRPGNPTPGRSPMVPLIELMSTLDPLQNRFFEKLDLELDKVESFYLDREKEAKARFSTLKQQLSELQDHRRFHETHQDHQHQWLPFSLRNPTVNSAMRSRISKMTATLNGIETDPQKLSIVMNESTETGLDLDEYYHAKKRLKKAVLEFYRTLEVLNNYRTLNMIGFRKALKKFEKVTLISVQDAYIREKVEPSTFASTKVVAEMLKDTENLLTSGFTGGDKKRAPTRSHAGSKQKSHHFASFWTGIALGLAIPAFAIGLYYRKSRFDEHTRQDIPAWGGLLFVYGIISVPVLFSLLIGINLLVWNRARIDYVSIFELDVKTKLDYQEYFEIPAILLAALCFAFWFSFARIGTHFVAPTTWPLIWLAFCTFFLINPLPIYHLPSRSWLFRIFGRLLVPGTRRVTFADFWMGDQFCSLAFPLSNLYFLGCVYVGGFNESWRECAIRAPHWGIPLALASLPLLVRFIQSIKRWYDLRHITHLINGGKYASGIVMYSFYFNWRHREGGPSGTSFIFYCLSAVWYSTYACIWDFLMDWSVLRVHVKYPLLREEILGQDYVPLYYLAIVSNVLIRFIWVLYVPVSGPNFLLRTFIAGVLEIFRRWQWNFYRLENEQVLGVDQYGTTRVVPLPYSFHDAA